MSAIANQWTGDGLADGTVITTGNVNSVGNGSTVARASSGAPTFVTGGHGFDVSGADSDIARLDASFTATKAARFQFKLTVGPIATAMLQTLNVRSASATVAAFGLGQGTYTGYLQAPVGNFLVAAQQPAAALGDVLLYDIVVNLSATPTTSNGRIFFRVKNLTNLTWNTTGEFFYDSLYTLNLALIDLSVTRFGKVAGGALATPTRWEFPGWEGITVNPAHTTEAQAKAYFADAPAVITPLDTPTVTVTGAVNPSTVGGTDGSITISWPPVSGAHHYEATIADGTITTGFVATDLNAVSPKTFVGLDAGPYTVAVRAKATA